MALTKLDRRAGLFFFACCVGAAAGVGAIFILLSSHHGRGRVGGVDLDAQAYLASLYEDPPHFACAGFDTNGDGYVSCTATPDSGPMAFECHWILHQCRLTEPRFFRSTP